MSMADEQTERATFGGGCFWCIEAVFQRLNGVVSVSSGYMGGKIQNPTYEQVCSGETGHAEVVQLKFDPSRISFQDLLDTFWKVHDPTALNRQGADVGTQYRSVIFYHSPEQKERSERAKAELQESGRFDSPVVTEIAPAQTFHPAEAYHENYYNRNSDAPYCQLVIGPKLKKLQEQV